MYQLPNRPIAILRLKNHGLLKNDVFLGVFWLQIKCLDFFFFIKKSQGWPSTAQKNKAHGMGIHKNSLSFVKNSVGSGIQDASWAM
jgi:hypothetical protein